MSELAYTPEESEDIFTTLKKAPDKGASLEELAKRYSKTPKSVKLHLRMKHPKYYNDWFGASAKADAKRLKVNELVDRLLDITNYDPKKRDWIKNTLGKSSFPQPFAEELYKQLVDNKLDAYLEEIRKLVKRSRIELWGLVYFIAVIILTTFINLSTAFEVFVYDMTLTEDILLFDAVIPGESYTKIMIGFSVAINLLSFPVVYFIYKARGKSLKQERLALNNYNNLLNNLPDYLIDEINQNRLESISVIKTTHFRQ